MTITPARRQELRLEDVPRAIRRAGFVPAAMQLVARGQYELRGGETFFRIRGWQTDLRIRAPAAAPTGETVLRAFVNYAGGDIVLEPMLGGLGSP